MMSENVSGPPIGQAADKEKSIIEAARKRFAHYGFSKVTMDEIAADIEMGKASLYYYFPTKESIFTRVIKQEQDELAYEIESIIGKNISCEQKLTEYVKVRLNYFQKLVNLGTLHAHSFMDNKSIYKKLFGEFEAKELVFVQNILDEGIKKGSFRKDLEKGTAHVILHLLQGLRFRVLKERTDLEHSEKAMKELQKEMNIAVNLILKGIIK